MTAVDPACDRAVEQLDAQARRQRRLEAFYPSCRRYVAELTCCSNELEDLADSFPALLFALVSGYGTAAAREQAFELVATGASLRQAADALGFPGGCDGCRPARSPNPCQASPSSPTSA